MEHSFGTEGSSNVADLNFHKRMFKDRRNPPKYEHIYTAQAPEDTNDMPRFWGRLLGGSILLLILGVILVSAICYKIFYA